VFLCEKMRIHATMTVFRFPPGGSTLHFLSLFLRFFLLLGCRENLVDGDKLIV